MSYPLSRAFFTKRTRRPQNLHFLHDRTSFLPLSLRVTFSLISLMLQANLRSSLSTPPRSTMCALKSSSWRLSAAGLTPCTSRYLLLLGLFRLLYAPFFLFRFSDFTALSLLSYIYFIMTLPIAHFLFSLPLLSSVSFRKFTVLFSGQPSYLLAF